MDVQGGYLVILFTLEVAHFKVVVVAAKAVLTGWLADWQRQGLGACPANERKGPVKGLLIDGRVETVDGANKRPLGDS